MTGNARYDKFFGEVNDLFAGTKEALREVTDVRAALSRRVGLPDDAAVDVLGARLRERTSHLAEEGLTLELEFTGIEENEDDDVLQTELEGGNAKASGSAEAGPESNDAGKSLPSATLRTPGREPEQRELRLLKVLAQAALSAATVYVDMGRAQHRTLALLEEEAKLYGQVATLFNDAAQRDLVRSKLTEAEQFLPELREQARHAANAADVLIAVLEEAANTASPGSVARRRPVREAPRDNAGAALPADRAPRRPAPKSPDANVTQTPAAPERATDFQP